MPIEDVDYLLDNSEHNSFIVNADSSLRDKRVHPSPAEFTLNFETPFNYVYGVDILDVSMPSSMWNVENINNSMKYHMNWYNPNYTAYEVNDDTFYPTLFNEIKDHPILNRFYENYEKRNSRMLFVDEKDAQHDDVKNILESTQEQNILAIRHVLPHAILEKIDGTDKLLRLSDFDAFAFFQIRQNVYRVSRRYPALIKELNKWSIFSSFTDKPIKHTISPTDREYTFVFENHPFYIPIVHSDADSNIEFNKESNEENPFYITVIEYAYIYDPGQLILLNASLNEKRNMTILEKWSRTHLKEQQEVLINIVGSRLFHIKNGFHLSYGDQTISHEFLEDVAQRPNTKIIPLYLFKNELSENWDYRVDFDQTGLNNRDIILPLPWHISDDNTKQKLELPLYRFDDKLQDYFFEFDEKRIAIKLPLPLRKYTALVLQAYNNDIVVTPHLFLTLQTDPLTRNFDFFDFHLHQDTILTKDGDLYIIDAKRLLEDSELEDSELEDSENAIPKYVKDFIHTDILTQDVERHTAELIPASLFIESIPEENIDPELTLTFKAPYENYEKDGKITFQRFKSRVTLPSLEFNVAFYNSRSELPKALHLLNSENDPYVHFQLDMPFVQMDEKDVVVSRHGYSARLYKLGDILYAWHESIYKDELTYSEELRVIVQQALYFYKKESLTIPVVLKSELNGTYVYQFTHDDRPYTFYSDLKLHNIGIYVYPEDARTLTMRTPFYKLESQNIAWDEESEIIQRFDPRRFYVFDINYQIPMVCAYDLRILDGTLDHNIVLLEEKEDKEEQEEQEKEEKEEKETVAETLTIRQVTRSLSHYIFAFSPETKTSYLTPTTKTTTIKENSKVKQNIILHNNTHSSDPITLPYIHYISRRSLNPHPQHNYIKANVNEEDPGVLLDVQIPLHFYKADNSVTNPVDEKNGIPCLPHDQSRFYAINATNAKNALKGIYYNPSFSALEELVKEKEEIEIEKKEKKRELKLTQLLHKASYRSTDSETGSLEVIQVDLEKYENSFYKHVYRNENDNVEFDFRFVIHLHVTDAITLSPKGSLRIDNNPIKALTFYTYRFVSHIELGNLFRRDEDNNLPTLPWCPFLVFNGYFELEPGNYNLFEFINELNNNFKSSRSFRGEAGVQYQYPFEGNNVIQVVKANDVGEVTKTGQIRFEIPVSHISFMLNLPKTKLRDTIGFSSNIRRNDSDFAYVLHPDFDDKDLVRSLPIERSDGFTKQTISPPGVVYLLGVRYVVLRCPEIESLIGTHAYGKYSPGIGLFILGLNQQLVKQRLDFVHYVRKPFHPIEKLNRLTFRFELQDGSLYDFKGVDMFMILQIKTYVPKKKHPFDYKSSRLNPNYNPDFIQFTIDEEQKRAAQERFTQNKEEDAYAYDSDDAQAIVHMQNQYEDDDSTDQEESERYENDSEAFSSASD